jgi:hypothetical protein
VAKIFDFINIKVMGKRYVARLMGIPTNITQPVLEQKFIDDGLLFKKLFFASQDSVHSAGYAFVEFECEDDMEKFNTIYILNSYGDSIYMED